MLLVIELSNLYCFWLESVHVEDQIKNGWVILKVNVKEIGCEAVNL